MNSSYGMNNGIGSRRQSYDMSPDDERSNAIPVEMLYLVDNPQGGVNMDYRQVVIHRHQENGFIYEPLDMTPGTDDGQKLSIKHATNEIYHKEANRLKTFTSRWRDTYFVKPSDLARDGFIYTGPADKVKCVFCLKSLRNWERGDSVEGEHRRHYPDCPFVSGKCHHLNIPINPEENMRRSLGLQMKTFQQSATAPQMQDFSYRLNSYMTWPKEVPVKPDALAEAGLFYSGKSDAVSCFTCGAIIASWEYGDDPWFEHAKASPNCAYIYNVKGSEFVRQIQEHENIDNSREKRIKLTNEPNIIIGNNAAATAFSHDKISSLQKEAQPLLYPVQVSSAQMDEDLNSPSVKAAMETFNVSVDKMTQALQRIRISKGPSHKVTLEDLKDLAE